MVSHSSGRLLAYGHSWVDGDGASARQRAFAALAARQLGLTLSNRAIGGSASGATAATVTSDPPPTAAVYLLMTGLNDARLHGRSAAAVRAYDSAIRQIVTLFRAASPVALVLAIEQPHLVDYSGYAPYNHGSDAAVDDYNEALQHAIAQEQRTRCVPVPLWDPGAMLAGDGVHPNDNGHAHLAEQVVRTIHEWSDLKEPDDHA